MIDGHADPAQRAVDHPRPVPRRLPVVRRPPAGADAEPRRARRGGRALRPPLQPGRAVRAGPRRALHRHVPDEQPGGGQRHAARRPLRQRRPHGRAAPATRRRCSATPTRASTRASPAGRTTRGCRRARGCCPASTSVLELPEDHTPVGRVAARARATRSRRLRPGQRGAGPAGDRARPAGRALHLGVPHRPAAGVDRPPGRAVVRPRQSYLRPHPPYDAAGAVRHDVRPRRLPGADRRSPARRHPLHEHGARRPRGRRPDRPGGDAPACARSTSG